MLESGLGLGEILDVAEAVGIPYDSLAAAMRGGSSVAARVSIAIAWVLYRRVRPELTLADASRWVIVPPERPPDAPDSAGPAPGGPLTSSS